MFYRWIALNVVGFSILLVFQIRGMVAPVYLADTSYIVYVITGLFLYGLTLCSYRVWKTSRELNWVKLGGRGKLKEFQGSASGPIRKA